MSNATNRQDHEKEQASVSVLNCHRALFYISNLRLYEIGKFKFRYSHGILPFDQRHRRNYGPTMWWENRLKRYTVLFRRKIQTKLKDIDIKLPDLTRCPAM